jgi:2-polyprenyl-3-methyl-5-hydroxy-6-metoxy-1,4-benzoquinol methylase
MYVDESSGLLRLLGDTVRLRLLRALSVEALNVSELTAVLGIAQSGVSRHLGLLRDAGLVAEDRIGGYAWYRLGPGVADARGERAGLWSWIRAEFDRASAVTTADDVRLREVRRVRKESFTVHGADTQRGQLVPGKSWAAWSRALAFLLPELDVVDLGCGEGYLSIEMAHWARHVTAVDRSREVLARAKALAARRGVSNITWKRGEIEQVSLDDHSADVVLFSQALHHALHPEHALKEAFRLLRPHGRLLVLDLREHDERWVKQKLGDNWPGFSEAGLRDLIVQAGFEAAQVRVGARTAGDPFVVLIAAGTKPATKRRATRRATAGAKR